VTALADVCHRKGAALVVDAYQSIGALPFDVHASGVDFLVGGTLKWLMGGPGMAFLYARRDRIAGAKPTAIGWWAMRDPFTFDVQHIDLAPSARRFEYGTPAVAAAYTARAGIALLDEIGIPAVRERHMALSQRLVDGALAQGWRLGCVREAERRTPIVTLRHPDPSAAVDALRARGCIVDHRPGLVRLSPHHFNTEDEIDATLELLAPLREQVLA
jgi:selenocysteine lyase/cysteine desulfurase